MNKSYGCVRAEKIKTGNVNSKGSLKSRYEHNLRITHVPANVDTSLSKYNKEYVSLEKGETYYSTFINKIDKAVETGHMGAIRKNAVLAAEIEINYSNPEGIMLSPEDADKWGQDATAWLQNRFGKDNVVHVVMHYDEDVTFDSNDPDCKEPMKHPHPHIHALIIPMDDRGKLNYFHFVKGPYGEKSTSLLQTEFYEAVGNKYNMQRGKHSSGMSYNDIREYKKNAKYERTVYAKNFEPNKDELTPEGQLLPTYSDRVITIATRQIDQHRAETIKIKNDFSNERYDLMEQIRNLQIKLDEAKKEAREEVERLNKEKIIELEKREHLLSEASLALRDLARDSENSTEKLEQILITYASLHTGLKNFPDKAKVEHLKSDILEVSKWQHKHDKKIEKKFDITK